MEKDDLVDTNELNLFGDEELFDVIPDDAEEIDYNSNPEKIGRMNWVGGKPQLSFSELCDKTKSIFTQVKGIPIIVRENDGENYIFKHDNEYVINIAKKPVAGISKYTAFNHELGHYAFDSLNNQFTEFIEPELKNIPKEHHDKAIELYRSIFNIVEDQRVESLIGDIYLGTGKRFLQARKRQGYLKGDKHKTPNPLDALHCARECRDDAIKEEFKYSKDIINEVELKDSDASIILAKDYINKVVNPWIIQQLNNCKNPFKTDCSGGFKIDENSPITCSDEFSNAFKQAFTENRSSDHRELENSMSESMRKAIEEAIAKSLEDSMNDSANKAESKIQAIKNKIEENARNSKRSFMPKNDHIKEVNGTKSSIVLRPNMIMAKNINKLLKLIQAKNKPKIRDIGDEISIPAVIRRKAKGFGDVFIKRVPRQKLAILISIDASGSMEGNPIKIARDMMATMYKSLDGIEGIELRGVIWSGGSATDVDQIKSYKQCNKIHTQSPFGGGTPTSYAVEYSEQEIEKMKAKKKLLIVITDGYPNTCYDQNLNAEQMVRRSINKARKSGIGTMGMMVGGDRDETAMNIMFGKDGFVTVNDMEEASHMLIKKFRKVVISQVNSK